MANPTLTLISSQTLGGTTASVTFSSIPATYNDLKLVVSSRNDGAGALANFGIIQFNADTGTSYSCTFVEGIGASAYSTRTNTTTAYGGNHAFQFSVNGIDSAGNTASVFSSNEIYIPNYTSATQKPFISTDGTEQNATTNNALGVISGLWSGTSAINSIKIFANSGNFVQYSNFYLYGIKNS